MKFNNKQNVVLAVLFISLGIMTTPGFAFMPGACQQDAEKLCPGASDKEVVPCLKQHQSEISTTCQANLAEARERVRQTREACADDTKKFCADVPSGKGRILQCLQTHASELSSECRAKIKETKEKILPGAPAVETSTPTAK